jgi:hypothetical protein
MGQEMFLSANYYSEFDTHYLAEEGTEEGTIVVFQGAKKLAAKEKKGTDEDGHAFRIDKYTPAGKALDAQRNFKLLIVL